MAFSFIRKSWWILRNFQFSKMVLGFCWSGYLFDIGWINSYLQQRPLDKTGRPLPWVTYPFLDFIVDRLNDRMIVLEFGSGNSTLFYARQVKKLYSAEHDAVWFDRVSLNLPSNVSLKLMALEPSGQYSRFAETIQDKLDIVIVDGRDRANCIRSSHPALASGGIVILDDSERDEYLEGVLFLLERGFKKLDFWGIAPGIYYKKCTSIFYRNENCLGL